MDKRTNRFIDDNDQSTKVIDLKEADIREDDAEDIDNLYEENEASASVDEPTRVIEKIDDKHHKHKKKDKKDKKDKDLEKENKRQERLKEKNSKKLEKLMKKQRHREEKSDREVLSYEDMPLEEREQAPEKPPKRKIKKKPIIIVLLIIAIVFGAVFIFASADKLSWHNIRNYVKYGILNQKSDEKFPVSVQGENVAVGNFIRMGQDICFASDTKLQIVNNYGRFEYSTQHGFTNPALKASNQYTLIYSLGGSGFQIGNKEKAIYSGQVDDRIILGDIIDNGTYALVTTSNGYLSKMRVYNKENEQIFGYSFADYYVTSISLAPNGKSAVVTGLSALNGSEISSIYVLDFTKDKPLYLEEIDENIFYEAQYLNDTYACAIGNSCVSVINTRSGEVNTLDYEGRKLTCYSINNDTDNFSVSLSRSGDGRNCEIISFNTNGTVSSSFETEYMVKYLSTYKGRVALLAPDKIYLYSKGGDKVSEKEVANEPRAVVLYTGSDAYVLDTNEISSMSI